MKLEVPEAVGEIARRLEEEGYETWAVGGAVRDALLGKARSDWDLATAARPDTVGKLFRPSYPIGIRFGTVGVRGRDGRVYEVTTFRRDIETDGRHAVVEYADSIEEDLSRRDFTINAIAYHPLQHVYRDPHRGREDLKRKVLRCVGDPETRFAEDYLRVLRGLRFAGRFELEVEAGTWRALVATTAKLAELSGERVREELLKVLATESPTAALKLYRTSRALAILLPQVDALDDAAWTQLLRTLKAIPAHRLGLRLAALLEPAWADAEELMTRLRFSNAELRVVRVLGAAVALELPDPGDAEAVRRWLRGVGRTEARDVLRLHFARARARGASQRERQGLAAQARAVLRVLRRGDPVTLNELAIDGEDLKALGLEPGPQFAHILERCLEAVLEEPHLNERERLLDYVRTQLAG